MFNEDSLARAFRLLSMWGASHFHVAANGDVHAVSGTNIFKLDGVHFQVDPTAEEHTADALSNASGGDWALLPLAPVQAPHVSGHHTGESVPDVIIAAVDAANNEGDDHARAGE